MTNDEMRETNSNIWAGIVEEPSQSIDCQRCGGMLAQEEHVPVFSTQEENEFIFPSR